MPHVHRCYLCRGCQRTSTYTICSCLAVFQGLFFKLRLVPPILWICSVHMARGNPSITALPITSSGLIAAKNCPCFCRCCVRALMLHIMTHSVQRELCKRSVPSNQMLFSSTCYQPAVYNMYCNSHLVLKVYHALLGCTWFSPGLLVVCMFLFSSSSCDNASAEQVRILSEFIHCKPFYPRIFCLG